MVRRRARIVIGLGAAVAALSFILIWGRPFAPKPHAPDQGPLTTVGDPWSMGLDPTNADRWTLGIYLCASDPAVVPVIDSIRPVQTVGSFDFLGASMRRFAPSNANPPIISRDGYPPTVPDAVLPAGGYEVNAGCSQREQSARFNELLLGIGRKGDGGGGWLGEEVAYHVAGRQYVLALEYAMLVCGPDVPAYC